MVGEAARKIDHHERPPTTSQLQMVTSRRQSVSIFSIFDRKTTFCPFGLFWGTFWTLYGNLSDLTSINDSLTIELNNLLN